nr:hypothetical protein [Comamonas testosteroni]
MATAIFTHLWVSTPIGVRPSEPESTMSLKITAEDLQTLKNFIVPLDTQERRKAYREGDFPRAELCKDVDKRYRWDLLHLSRIKIGDGVGVQGNVNLYSYMDDSHIDSALRSFIKPLKSVS